MNFEWDPAKSIANKDKHGVSFEEAVAVWDDAHVDVENIARSGSESRSATLGRLNGGVYTVIWTRRLECIRIISVRKARNYEQKAYEKFIQDSQSDG